MVMDISFASFTESVPSMAAAFCHSKGGIVPDISKNEEIKAAEENQRRYGHKIPRFVLTRGLTSVEFAPLDESEFLQWKEAITTYTIQKKVWNNYKFSEVLGQWSFGKVFLAQLL